VRRNPPLNFIIRTLNLISKVDPKKLRRVYITSTRDLYGEMISHIHVVTNWLQMVPGPEKDNHSAYEKHQVKRVKRWPFCSAFLSGRSWIGLIVLWVTHSWQPTFILLMTNIRIRARNTGAVYSMPEFGEMLRVTSPLTAYRLRVDKLDEFLVDQHWWYRLSKLLTVNNSHTIFLGVSRVNLYQHHSSKSSLAMELSLRQLVHILSSRM